MPRTSFVIAQLGVLLLAACHDGSHVAQGPAGSDLTWPPRLQHQLGPNDTQLGRSARDVWDRLSPEEKAAAVRTVEQVYASRGEAYFRPQLAIASGPLPDDAEVLVIREPLTPGQPLIVVSRSAVHSNALSLGHAALREDARRQRKIASRRRLAVSSDGSVVVTTAASRERWHVMLPPAEGGGRDLLTQLTRSATSISKSHLPEVGEAMLLRFD